MKFHVNILSVTIFKLKSRHDFVRDWYIYLQSSKGHNLKNIYPRVVVLVLCTLNNVGYYFFEVSWRTVFKLQSRHDLVGERQMNWGPWQKQYVSQPWRELDITIFSDYNIFPKYWNWETCTNSLHPDQMLHSAASDQGVYYLPPIQQFLDTWITEIEGGITGTVAIFGANVVIHVLYSSCLHTKITEKKKEIKSPPLKKNQQRT